MWPRGKRAGAIAAEAITELEAGADDLREIVALVGKRLGGGEMKSALAHGSNPFIFVL
jgi:hypothetical protein